MQRSPRRPQKPKTLNNPEDSTYYSLIHVSQAYGALKGALGPWAGRRAQDETKAKVNWATGYSYPFSHFACKAQLSSVNAGCEAQCNNCQEYQSRHNSIHLQSMLTTSAVVPQMEEIIP